MKYRVTCTYETTEIWWVEAESEHEAINLADRGEPDDEYVSGSDWAAVPEIQDYGISMSAKVVHDVYATAFGSTDGEKKLGDGE